MRNWRDEPDAALRHILTALPWSAQARTEQLPPPGAWRVWYVRGGRGSGKTRTGSETLADWIRDTPAHDWAAVGPTFGDARDVCIEGPSGLLKALSLPRSYRGWNRSYGELLLPDGGTVFCDGADDGALRIQGKNLAGLWADEVGLWRQWRLAWEESIAYAVRIDPARIVATGTPKRGHPLVKKLIAESSEVGHTRMTRMRTIDNAANLSATALADLLERYGGTSLGRQELDGEELADVDGALVQREMVRYGTAPLTVQPGSIEPRPTYQRIVIPIDPAVSYGPDSDETGIVVTAKGIDANGYVLDDLSGRYSPRDWAQHAIRAYEQYGADAIIGEVNNGGDLVEANLRAAGFAGRFIKVHASRGKRVRAEPVASMYEQGRVFHARPFPELEDQWCTFTPDSLDSPDRLDAEVWGFTELFPVVNTDYTGSLVGSN